jgi:NADPH:quinone reductase-like Zn-dependent oxidoreductase/acyl carrier protein
VWRVRLSSPAGDRLALDVTDELGRSIVAVDSLVLREPPAGLAAAGGGGGSLFTLGWEPIVGDAGPPVTAGRWAVVGPDDLGLVDAGVVTTVHADLAALGDAIETDAGTPAPDLVVVACPTPDGDLAGHLGSTVSTVLGWVQEWLADPRFAESRLVLVTHGATGLDIVDPDASGITDADQAGLGQAPVWGLLGSAEVENPGRFVLVDTDVEAPGQQLIDAAATGETKVVIRRGELWRRRLTRVPGALPVLPQGEWALGLPTPGVLDGLAIEPVDPATLPGLRPHEVRVAVEAAGLNFQDVLVALGLVELPAGIERFGGEGAGVVVEVGSDVTRLAVGDRVMGLLGGSMASSVVVDSRVVVPMPDGWSYARAASVPLVFLTAYHGLVGLAGLQPGETVLIHAAAGGVGMAAVAIARHLGAEVFATAHPSKWDALEAMGIDRDHIASSRDPRFAEAFGVPVGPGRIDVVLNSLAGEFVDASLALLAAGGRFVEVGKTDVRDPAAVAAAHPGVVYRQFDVWVLAGEEADHTGAMLAGLVGLLDAGTMAQPPVRTWPMDQAQEAFRFMSQTRHVGKIVLTRPGFDPEGKVLITGGTGTLGRLVAHHLVARHGVRHLVLTSRQGRKAAGVADLVTGLEAAGATVEVAACDASDRTALAGVLADIAAGPRPLRAIVHAAGLVEDALVSSLTTHSLERVLAPKALGAWHLHELSRELELDLSAFLLFSSASGAAGAGGQANYASANVFLDTLAAHRRRSGLPGMSLAWGQWEEVSGTTDQLNEIDSARLRGSGFVPLATDAALALFDAALGRTEPIVMPIHIDMPALRKTARLALLPALWHRLAGSPTRHASTLSAAQPTTDRSELLRRLGTSSEADQVRVLVEVVQAEVAAVLGHLRPEAVEIDSAFKDLGFDSLTAVELRNRLNILTGLRLPATLAFDHPTVRLLAQQLHALMSPANSAA